MNTQHARQLILTGLLFVCATANDKPSQKTVAPAERTAFAFDIDRVLIGPSFKQWQLAWQYKLPLASALIDISLMSTALRYWWSEQPVDTFITLFEQNNRPQLAEFVKKIILSREKIPGTIAIVQELYQAGYPLYIATNQSAPVFTLNRHAHPNLFALFTGIQYAQYTEPIIKKPQENYYHQLRSRIGKDKKIIFIDDKEENIRGAQKCGLIGIHFTNAYTLRKALRQHEVLPSTRTAEKPMAIAL